MAKASDNKRRKESNMARGRRLTECKKRKAQERRKNGIWPVMYVRMCLGDRAYAASKGMSRKEFCDFASAAVLKEAKRKGIHIPEN